MLLCTSHLFFLEHPLLYLEKAYSYKSWLIEIGLDRGHGFKTHLFTYSCYSVLAGLSYLTL